jgi:hypothetical protein
MPSSGRICVCVGTKAPPLSAYDPPMVAGGPRKVNYTARVVHAIDSPPLAENFHRGRLSSAVTCLKLPSMIAHTTALIRRIGAVETVQDEVKLPML